MGVLSAGEETIVKVKLLNKHSDDKFLIQSYNVTDDMPHCSALDVVGLKSSIKCLTIFY